MKGSKQSTRLITEPVEALIRQKNLNVCLQQMGSLFTLFFGKGRVTSFQDTLELDHGMYTKFFQHLFNRGILAPPLFCEAWFIS